MKQKERERDKFNLFKKNYFWEREAGRQTDRQPDRERQTKDILVSFDEGNVEDWEVVVDKLEQVDLQRKRVIKFSLRPS